MVVVELEDVEEPVSSASLVSSAGVELVELVVALIVVISGVLSTLESAQPARTSDVAKMGTRIIAESIADHGWKRIRLDWR